MRQMGVTPHASDGSGATCVSREWATCNSREWTTSGRREWVTYNQRCASGVPTGGAGLSSGVGSVKLDGSR
jgi:hypothetical protein